jgi:hypothetical protein
MLTLRDYFCKGCGVVVEDVMIDGTTYTASCACGYSGEFGTVVNGGIRSRYRCMDWPDDPEFYRGQIKAGGVTARDTNGEDVKKYHSGSRKVGDVVHTDSRYDPAGDRRAERRDRIRHKTRRKRGTLPVVIDQKG